MNLSSAQNTGHRDETDESLRNERIKSDREVYRREHRDAGLADSVIEQARDDADEVLRSAREADPSPSNPAQARARGEADAAILQRRAAADVKLDEERRERTHALAALFMLEREITDQHLLAERNRADLALNNRDDFLAMVAHDMRGFMGEIALRAAVLVKTAGDDEVGDSSVRIGRSIQRATAGMKRLVSDLMDVAAIEAGRLHVNVATGDVASVLRDAAETFRDAAEAKGIALELGDTPETVMAVFDNDRVVQILGNLIMNAIKFTPSGGRISLQLQLAEAEARLIVVDTGIGIDATRLEHVFERFTQIGVRREGLGLGLYISRCLVEAQRGLISGTSVPGSGSTFSFTLPLAGS